MPTVTVDFMRRIVSVAQTVEELAHLRIVPEAKRKARLRTMSAPTFVVDAIAHHLASSRGGLAPEPDARIFSVLEGDTASSVR